MFTGELFGFWGQRLISSWHKWQRQHEWYPDRQWTGSHPHPHLLNTFNPESRSTWCLTLALWSVDIFFPPFFTFILSKLCSSPLKCLIFVCHMPCSHGSFLRAITPFPFVLSLLYKQWLVAFFTCLHPGPTPFILTCLWICVIWMYLRVKIIHNLKLSSRAVGWTTAWLCVCKCQAKPSLCCLIRM